MLFLLCRIFDFNIRGTVNSIFLKPCLHRYYK